LEAVKRFYGCSPNKVLKMDFSPSNVIHSDSGKVLKFQHQLLNYGQKQSVKKLASVAYLKAISFIRTDSEIGYMTFRQLTWVIANYQQ
jgi:hypothetical protein